MNPLPLNSNELAIVEQLVKEAMGSIEKTKKNGTHDKRSWKRWSNLRGILYKVDAVRLSTHLTKKYSTKR